MYQLVVFLLVIYFIASTEVTEIVEENPYHQFFSRDGLGAYVYGYVNPQSTKTESRTSDGVVIGGYSYIDPNGKVQTVEYTADSMNGFRATVSNLPNDDPEVSYAKFKHFKEYERIKAEHAAVAAQHKRLAEKLLMLDVKGWNERSNEEEKKYFSQLTNRQDALTNLYDWNSIKVYEQETSKENDEGGRNEKWEDTWEAQKLRDQENRQNVKWNDQKLQGVDWNNYLNQNINGHKEAYEAVLAAERQLIERANAERNSQLEASHQQSHSNQAEMHQQPEYNNDQKWMTLEHGNNQWNSENFDQKWMTSQHGNGQWNNENNDQKLMTSQHGNSQWNNENNDQKWMTPQHGNGQWNNENNDQKWMTPQYENNQWNNENNDQISMTPQHGNGQWNNENKEQYRSAYDEVIRAEKEHIARAQAERNRQLKAYVEAMNRHNKDAYNLQKTDDRRNQQQNYENYWNTAINGDQMLVSQNEKLPFYQNSAILVEDNNKEKQSWEYNYAIDFQNQKELNRQIQENIESHGIRNAQDANVERKINEKGSEFLKLSRKRAFAEAERAFKDFGFLSKKNVPVQVHHPMQVSTQNTENGGQIEISQKEDITSSKNKHNWSFTDVQEIKDEHSETIKLPREARAIQNIMNSSGNQNEIPLKTTLIPSMAEISSKLHAPWQLEKSFSVTPSAQVMNIYSYGPLGIRQIKGDYSFIDNNGVLQTMKYVSDHLKGFRITDLNSALESIKTNISNTTIEEKKEISDD